jgi:nicotinate-nucleotide adenylyltransferase
VRIALLGGSFNPVHIGHLALADDVRASLGYDRVILVPANIPPHKTIAGGVTAADRLAMLDLAVADTGWLTIDPCEIERGGVSFTIDTIRHIADKYEGVIEGKPGFVFGHDLVAGFSSWKDPDRIAEEADIILARRPDSFNGPCKPESSCAAPVAGESFSWRHIALENPLLPISSSLIREGIAAKKGWRYLVPEPVYRYIVEHHLYEH